MAHLKRSRRVRPARRLAGRPPARATQNPPIPRRFPRLIASHLLARPTKSIPIAPTPDPTRWPTLLSAAIIVVAAIASYGNSFHRPFVFDDLPSIVDNPTIRHLTDVRSVLSPPGDGSTVTGRPLVNLTFALNYSWGGLNPWGYHFLNLVIHTLAALALFGAVRRTLRQPVCRDPFAASATLLAVAMAVLWTVHPLQTESVTFVVQRAESLMGLTYLATLYFFVRGADNGSRGWLAAAVGSCALGMGCKETMATAPLVVLLHDRTFFAGSFAAAFRQRRWFYLGLAATWVPLVLLLTAGGGTRGAGAGLGLGVAWWSYALKQCEAIVHYLRLAIWPSPLVFDYGVDAVSTLWAVTPQAGLLLVLGTATLTALWRRPAIGYLGTWFLLILAPSSSVIPIIGQTEAEHRMYLPLAAVVAGVVLTLFRFLGRGALAVVAVLAVAGGALTAQRNLDYRDAVALWRDTVRKRPENYRAHYNLAVQLARTPSGRKEAIAEYEASLRLQPDYPDAHNNLGVELTQVAGREDGAVAEFEAALRLRPDFADAHYNLAGQLGRRPDGAAAAIAHYEAALRIRPDHAEAHNNLAVLLAGLPGRLPDAIGHYQLALRFQPDYPEAHYGLANALAATPDRLPEALEHYMTALRLRPDDANAHYFLAVALSRLPDRAAEAISHYETAVKLAPGNCLAHYNLANELARLPPRLPDAIAHYEAAVRIKPDFAEARNNLAGAYYRSGRWEDAIQQLTVVLQLNPGNQNARRNLEMLKSQHPH